ncbi:MAG: hypothetical protein QM235_04690 [Pseudomonadota bacterium]|nr:hypothetical protein [Pseudomonadota bacterium]
MDEKPKTHKQVMDGLPDGPKNEPSNLADIIADKPDKEHKKIMDSLKG